MIVKRELRKSYAILDRIYEFLLFSSHAVDIDKIQCKICSSVHISRLLSCNFLNLNIHDLGLVWHCVFKLGGHFA